jgi:hypothetical protein
VGVIVTSRARLCRLCRLAEPAHAAATAGFSIQEGEIPRETDCLLEEGVMSELVHFPASWENTGKFINFGL